MPILIEEEIHVYGRLRVAWLEEGLRDSLDENILSSNHSHVANNEEREDKLVVLRDMLNYTPYV